VFGRGTALQLAVKCPGYDADVADNVPYLDMSGVHDAKAGTVTLFAVNRHATDSLDVSVDLHGFGALAVVDHQTMVHADLEAVNDLKNPLAVTPKKGKGAKVEGSALKAKLPPHSYQMIRLGRVKA